MIDLVLVPEPCVVCDKLVPWVQQPGQPPMPESRYWLHPLTLYRPELVSAVFCGAECSVAHYANELRAASVPPQSPMGGIGPTSVTRQPAIASTGESA